MPSAFDLTLTLGTVLSFGIWLSLRSQFWHLTYLVAHLAICLLMYLATFDADIFPIAAASPLTITFALCFARCIGLLFEPRGSTPWREGSRRPDGSFQLPSSLTSRRFHRFFLHAFRTVSFVFWTIFVIENTVKDVRTFNYMPANRSLMVASGMLVDILFSCVECDGKNYFPLFESGIAYFWLALFAEYALFPRSQLYSSFFIIEVWIWFMLYFAAKCIKRCSPSELKKDGVPSIWSIHFRHFIVTQTVIDLFHRSDPQKFAVVTIFATWAVGLVHVFFRSTAVTYGAGALAGLMLRQNGRLQVKTPTPTYMAGIVSVEDLITIPSLYAPNVPEKLRKFPAYIPDDTHRIAALSYKHKPPYKRPVKIAPEDYDLALRVFKMRGITHVWIDFVQNARSALNRRSTTWFEEGVAPFIQNEVIILWTADEAMDRMWIRIEEMAGLLGRGVFHAKTEESAPGAELDLQSAILQLGARCSVGELAGCEGWYKEDIDDINRTYGEAIVKACYDLPFVHCRVPDDSDIVYRSQVTLNILIEIPDHLPTNWTEAEGALTFLVGREWQSSEDAGEADSRRLKMEEQYRRVKVFSNRGDEDDEITSGTFDVVGEVTAGSGTAFRVVSQARIRDGGRVEIVRHRWIGEKRIDLSRFEEVDRSEWMKWGRNMENGSVV